MTGNDHAASDEEELTCTRCHMVRTVTSAAGTRELLDDYPEEEPAIQYVHGDLRSHRFTVTGIEAAPFQPVAATHNCAYCHSVLIPNLEP